MKEWTVSNIKDAEYLGEFEIQPHGSGHSSIESLAFLRTKDYRRLVFGNMCNTGFLESGYMEMSDWESLNENLSELIQELETYYRDGRGSCSRIVCNERM